jgi:hypothetical protein
MTIHFEGSIVKVTKGGVRVLSNTLEKGEKLADGRTYAQVKKGKTIGKHTVEGTGGLTFDPATGSSVPIRD